MQYEIRLWREVFNSTLHVIMGGAIAHTFLPYLSLFWIIVILCLLGAGREFWQYKRNKIQPLYIHIIDTGGFILGGLIWWLIVTSYNINVDIL